MLIIWEMLLPRFLECQESYHKEEEKSHFPVNTIVKNQEKKKVNVAPALRESCVHQGAKLAAYLDTACIMDFKETLYKSFVEESKCHRGSYLALHNCSSFSTIKKNVKSGSK